MGAQLDSALAGLAHQLGTTATLLGPETVKAYGASLMATAHVCGVWLIVLGVIALLTAALALFKEDGEGWIAATIGAAVFALISAMIYGMALVDLAAYTASPIGATATHFLGR